MRPQRRQPTRLPRPWDSPGKNTGVGCHFFLQCRKVKSESEVSQSCPTLSDPMDCSPPGSSIHGIFQARVLEWGASITYMKGPQKNSLQKKVLCRYYRQTSERFTLHIGLNWCVFHLVSPFQGSSEICNIQMSLDCEQAGLEV